MEREEEDRREIESYLLQQTNATAGLHAYRCHLSITVRTAAVRTTYEEGQRSRLRGFWGLKVGLRLHTTHGLLWRSLARFTAELPWRRSGELKEVTLRRRVTS